MSTCRHLNRIKEDVVCVKIRDPSQWKCSSICKPSSQLPLTDCCHSECGTTDDVWACLSCGWLSCKSGRCEKHARVGASNCGPMFRPKCSTSGTRTRAQTPASSRSQQPRMPLVSASIQNCPNSYCYRSYLCDDSVANDTRKGCLAKIRAVLEEVATGVPAPSRTRKVSASIHRASRAVRELLASVLTMVVRVHSFGRARHAPSNSLPSLPPSLLSAPITRHRTLSTQTVAFSIARLYS